MVTMNNWNYI